MPLWRVDVSGVSHRYVEAETKDEAVFQVEQALIRAMNIRATPAHPNLKETYVALGPLQRKNLLASIEGLTNPQERQRSKAAKRRLERLVKREQEEAEWKRSARAKVPPMSPELADEIARMLELRHIERNYDRLPEWGRHSPIHGDE